VPERAPGGDGAAAVVALGGGHGLAVALRAVRRYARPVTAVVTVADDGGSSGRLRRDLGVPAPGDLRRCLDALAAGDSPWAEALEHRFATGELAGHALGNLLIVGLTESLGDLCAALDEIGRLVGAVGRVLPATIDPVVLAAQVAGQPVEGQVALAAAGGRGAVRDVRLVPADARACPDAIAAIGAARQVLLAPGSLYTSVIAACSVPEVREAIRSTDARVVQVANLRPEQPETEGLDGTDHLRAVLEAGVRVDAFLYDPEVGLEVDAAAVRALGVEPVAARVAAAGGMEHDPSQLAGALRALL
jgi:uncharacterized cofD-like protein